MYVKVYHEHYYEYHYEHKHEHMMDFHHSIFKSRQNVEINRNLIMTFNTLNR